MAINILVQCMYIYMYMYMYVQSESAIYARIHTCTLYVGGSGVSVANRAPWLVIEDHHHHRPSLDDK